MLGHHKQPHRLSAKLSGCQYNGMHSHGLPLLPVGTAAYLTPWYCPWLSSSKVDLQSGLGPSSSKAETPSMLQNSATGVPGCIPALTFPAGSCGRSPHCATALACLGLGAHHAFAGHCKRSIRAVLQGSGSPCGPRPPICWCYTSGTLHPTPRRAWRT